MIGCWDHMQKYLVVYINAFEITGLALIDIISSMLGLFSENYSSLWKVGKIFSSERCLLLK